MCGDIIRFSSNEKSTAKTYKKNHPNTEVRGDVCEADFRQINREFGPIDVVIGGPPCQVNISCSGKH